MTVTQTITRPTRSLGPIGWMRKNLFSTWYNALLTIISLYVVIRVLIGLVIARLCYRWLELGSLSVYATSAPRPEVLADAHVPEEGLFAKSITMA